MNAMLVTLILISPLGAEIELGTHVDVEACMFADHDLQQAVRPGYTTACHVHFSMPEEQSDD